MNNFFDSSYDEDTLHEECGVFGMYDFDGADVASTIYYGLFALQHRGQDQRERFGPIRAWDWSTRCLHGKIWSV